MGSRRLPPSGGCRSAEGGAGCGWGDVFGSFRPLSPGAPRLALRGKAPHWPKFTPGVYHLLCWESSGTPLVLRLALMVPVEVLLTGAAWRKLRAEGLMEWLPWL